MRGEEMPPCPFNNRPFMTGIECFHLKGDETVNRLFEIHYTSTRKVRPPKRAIRKDGIA